jgi:hypothetical protein
MILKLIHLAGRRNLIKLNAVFNRSYASLQKLRPLSAQNLKFQNATTDLVRRNSFESLTQLQRDLHDSEKRNSDNTKSSKSNNVYVTVAMVGLALALGIKSADCESSNYKFVSENRNFLKMFSK